MSTGNKLQQLLKSNRPPLSGSYVSDNSPIVYLQPARLVLEVEISEGRHPGLAMATTGSPPHTPGMIFNMHSVASYSSCNKNRHQGCEHLQLTRQGL